MRRRRRAVGIATRGTCGICGQCGHKRHTCTWELDQDAGIEEGGNGREEVGVAANGRPRLTVDVDEHEVEEGATTSEYEVQIASQVEDPDHNENIHVAIEPTTREQPPPSINGVPDYI